MTDRTRTASAQGPAAPPPRTFLEELEVSGADLVERVRDLAREGNARRVTPS